MKLHSYVQPAEFLGLQHTQLITCKIPGHTATIVQPSHALCTLYLEIAWIWCDLCACADLLTQNPTHMHPPNIKMAGQDIRTLEYSQVVKIPESEGLLVHHCSARLGEFGLTLWVVSILMCDQEFHNKNWCFSLSLSCHVAANKEHICMTKNFNFLKNF